MKATNIASIWSIQMLSWCTINVNATTISLKWFSMHCVKTKKKRNSCWWSRHSMTKHYRWSTISTKRLKSNKKMNLDQVKPKQSTQCSRIWGQGLQVTSLNGVGSSKAFNLEFQSILKSRLCVFTSLNWRLLSLLGKKERNSLRLHLNREPLCRWKKVDKNCKHRWTQFRKRFNQHSKM